MSLLSVEVLVDIELIELAKDQVALQEVCIDLYALQFQLVHHQDQLQVQLTISH